MATYIMTGNGTINLALNNRQYTIGTDHVNYGAIKANLKNDKVLATLVDIPKSIKVATKGTVEIHGDVVKYKGEEMHNALTRRIVGLVREGLPFEGFVNLLERIMKNPSNRSRQEGYNFLDKEGIPITPEGMVLGYKVVQSDYWSKTGGKLKLLQGKVRADGRIYNAPGEVIECERGDVDDNAQNTCSHGLHVGGVGYATPGGAFYSTGDKVVIIEFDPADIVSVPNDYNATKIRVCKYKVVAEYAETFDKVQYEVNDGNITASQPSQHDWVGGNWADYEDDEYEDEDEYEDDYEDEYDDEEDEDDYEEVELVDEYNVVCQDREADRYIRNIDGTYSGYDKFGQPVASRQRISPTCIEMWLADGKIEEADDVSTYTTNTSQFGKKPDGSKFWNVRDSHGHFKKK